MNPRIKITPSSTAESIIRGGHPWLFSDSIRKQNREGNTGEFAVVYDRNNKFLAIGLYDPHSPIRVRILHQRKPVTLDNEWWKQHLHKSIQRRQDLFDNQTTGYRLCNGESDGWPGLVIDRYDTTLVIKIYTSAWFPHLKMIIDLINQEIPNERIVLRLSRNIQTEAKRKPPHLTPLPQGKRKTLPSPLEGEGQDGGYFDGGIISGKSLTGPVVFKENSIAFEAEVLNGQKTGFFLDQRENRQKVGELSAGRKVLNAFSFSGGFSLYAAKGGATSVTDIDISAHALESAKRNFALNKTISQSKHLTIQANVFDWLRDTPKDEKFDLIILDPPSLAKKESDRADAIQAYGRLASGGMEHLSNDGILVAASCSAHVSAEEFFGAVRQAAQKSGRKCQELQTTGHPPDHPAAFPEAQYLKCIYLQIKK